jgi:hypothetical protein
MEGAGSSQEAGSYARRTDLLGRSYSCNDFAK